MSHEISPQESTLLLSNLRAAHEEMTTSGHDTSDVDRVALLAGQVHQSLVRWGSRNAANLSQNWQHEANECALHSQQFSAAIIAESSTSQLKRLVQALCDWEAGCPCIVVGEFGSSIDFAAEIRGQITEILPSKLSHQLLLNAIHKAKLFHEHLNFRVQGLVEKNDLPL